MTFLQADLMAYKIYMEYNVTQISNFQQPLRDG